MFLTCVEARLQSDERKLFQIWTLSAGGWLSAETLEKYQHIFPRDLHVLDACSSEGQPADAGPGTVDWESSPLHFRPSSAPNTDNMQVCKRQKHLKYTRTKPVQQAQPVDLFPSVAVAPFNTPSIWGCEINLADTPDWWIWSCSAVPTSLKNKCNNKSVSTYIWPRKATVWCPLDVLCVIPQHEQKVLPVLRRYLPKQKSADRVCQVFWQHGGLKSFSCVSERHNRNQTDQSHVVGATLTRLPPSEGVYRHACCYLPCHGPVPGKTDLSWTTRLWAQAEPVVSGWESIFSCCPPQVQSQLYDIMKTGRSPTFNTWYLYLHAGSMMPALIYRQVTIKI